MICSYPIYYMSIIFHNYYVVPLGIANKYFRRKIEPWLQGAKGFIKNRQTSHSFSKIPTFQNFSWCGLPIYPFEHSFLTTRGYCMNHRGPGFLAPPHPLPRLVCQQVVSLSQSSCVSPVELSAGRSGEGMGEELNHTTTSKSGPL
jgi:hypothetical protein